MANPDEAAAGRPVVLRGGTVLTMDDAHTILADADVLVTGDRIAAVGPRLEAPDGALEIDASGGIVMPGMIDTHRHMWQTAMRGYGADWTLTQYFVWYYLEHGKTFRPQDIHAGNVLAGIESLDAGVTTTVDWSHGLQTTEHADAAVDALTSVPGRFVLAYGNIQAGPWEWSTRPEFRDFVSKLLATQGVKAPTRSVPAAVAGPLAQIGEVAWRMLPLPGQPPLTARAKPRPASCRRRSV